MQRVTIELSDVLYDELQTAVAGIREPGYTPADFAQEIVEGELASRRLRAITPAAYGPRVPRIASTPVAESELKGYAIAWPTKAATYE